MAISEKQNWAKFSCISGLKVFAIYHLEHIEIKRFCRIHPSQLQIGVCKAQLVSRSEMVDLIKPETGK